MEQIKEVGNLLMDKLPMFVQSADLEVQERVSRILNFRKQIKEALVRPLIGSTFLQIFSHVHLSF